jgi:hypothetical protein
MYNANFNNFTLLHTNSANLRKPQADWGPQDQNLYSENFSENSSALKAGLITTLEYSYFS